jgi:NADH dehydrogenase [ubiquinone] 1 alpha subcomplex assembly factor 5
MSETAELFNRRSVRQHRDRAAANFGDFDFLFREAGERLADRLDDIKRHFPLALDLGCHGGQMAALLGERGGISTLVQSDLSFNMVCCAKKSANGLFVNADEEFLPFSEGRFDLVLSCLSLHWVNDLPGVLAQIRRILKPDGLFLAVMLGGETLKELQVSLATAEIAEEGGLSPRISPFVHIKDAGDLLIRAGFSLPVADLDTISVSYPDPLKLMEDLRSMGEANAVSERRKTFSRCATLDHALRTYRTTFADNDERVPATFETITLTGWAP